jgi:hypothetical protein
LIGVPGVILKYNPEIVAVAYTHPPATVRFSVFRRVPDVYNQESCILAALTHTQPSRGKLNRIV